MPIGNGPEPPEYDKEKEMEMREMNKVYDWWETLSEQEQWDIIADYMPENINEETDPNEEYGDMLWDEQFDIYRDNNPREFLTEEEKDNIIADIEYEERKLKGDEIW